MIRTLTWENQWGDDGDLLVGFGHHDRAEFAAAVTRYCREEWGTDPDPWWVADDVRHIYGALAPWCDLDEPIIHYQRMSAHPEGHRVVPMTVLAADCPIATPDVATIVNLIEQSHPQITVGIDRPDPLADRLIAKTVHHDSAAYR